MDRIQSLIAKLKEQADQNEDPSKMLATVQLIQNELAGATARPRVLGTSKVAVVLPAASAIPSQYEKYIPKATPEPLIEVKETVVIAEKQVSVIEKNGQLDMVFDPMKEIPTLAQQVKDNKESASLNDRLKQSATELAEVLKDTPIKDLRKAIGINDRFIFINDLFRGDESTYERSIRTINGFNIFAEAEYWISRELKVKLGWNADDPAVILFDQLVKRRFS